MIKRAFSGRPGYLLFAGLMVVAALAYWPGLSGGWLFDDYPNIVDNSGVHPVDGSIASLVRAALSSPSSEFKRPLASLSFAANYLVSGLDPYGMKLTNLLVHLLNGLLVFILAGRLLRLGSYTATQPIPAETSRRIDVLASLVAGSWLLLPINLTAVLYVVQRMESLANLLVLVGLIGYLKGRQGMLCGDRARYRRGLALCAASCTVPTAIGALAKETAVMLPLYAATIEWVLFRFRRTDGRRDAWLTALFAAVLVLPLLIGLGWLLPGVLRPATWAARDFTLKTRLLSEARIVTDYIGWTLLPTPDALSFYHDDFNISAGVFSPWTTFASLVALAAITGLALALRHRKPLVSLGLFLYLGCHLLTGTVLPLELIYEHRNYFASFGLLLAVLPALGGITAPPGEAWVLVRRVLLGGLLVLWAALTAITASAWGNPLSLAAELAARAPGSPRAQYELGRTYIVYSRYDPESPFTKLAYAPLERAAAMPASSILPQQALIFMNSRMGLPTKDAWWDSLTAKLKLRKPGVQDESSLGALTKCQIEHLCNLPENRMIQAFLAALSHSPPSARLLATYSDYAWNVLEDRDLGERMAAEAVRMQPGEPAYRITLIRMMVRQRQYEVAREALEDLQSLNVGGRLDADIASLRSLFP